LFAFDTAPSTNFAQNHFVRLGAEEATLTFAPNWHGTISGNTPDDLFNG
jgi:hypothetical protein